MAHAWAAKRECVIAYGTINQRISPEKGSNKILAKFLSYGHQYHSCSISKIIRSIYKPACKCHFAISCRAHLGKKKFSEELSWFFIDFSVSLRTYSITQSEICLLVNESELVNKNKHGPCDGSSENGPPVAHISALGHQLLGLFGKDWRCGFLEGGLPLGAGWRFQKCIPLPVSLSLPCTCGSRYKISATCLRAMPACLLSCS